MRGDPVFQGEILSDQEQLTALEKVQDAYLKALYWTDTGCDSGQPPKNAVLTAFCRATALNDCATFYQAIVQTVREFLPGELDWTQIGRDLWLARNGHGTGFWDYPEIYGESTCLWLTAMAQAMGEQNSEFEDWI